MPDSLFHTAPASWTFEDPNPFTSDGSYGAAWSAFCILDPLDDQCVTGQSGQGPFSARFGRNTPHLAQHLADFLRYEQKKGRRVILQSPPDIDTEAYAAQALSITPAPDIIRPEDPPILVHSTRAAAWQRIQADGTLKAASLLIDTGSPNAQEPGPLDDYLQHDPPEYRDHIMFSEMDACGPEMVAASYQAGRFAMDDQAVYTPGVRLYFDGHHILRDGLGVRDGLHILKVHQSLPLQPYLIAAICAQDIHPADKIYSWTPRLFTEQANAVLLQKIRQESL